MYACVRMFGDIYVCVLCEYVSYVYILESISLEKSTCVFCKSYLVGNNKLLYSVTKAL